MNGCGLLQHHAFRVQSCLDRVELPLLYPASPKTQLLFLNTFFVAKRSDTGQCLKELRRKCRARVVHRDSEGMRVFYTGPLAKPFHVVACKESARIAAGE